MSAAAGCSRRRFLALMFGMTAAPIFWLGQTMLGYSVPAMICYGGDHPTLIEAGAPLRNALLAFDIVAIAAALVGGAVSILCWRALPPDQGRPRFMAMWGMISSLWFLGAILFGTIASLTVPLCTG